MGADLGYESQWRSLRRREIFYWTVVLSYLPTVSALIFLLDALEGLAPMPVGGALTALWILAFLVAGLSLQSFKCPRCDHSFFGKRRFYEFARTTCAHCKLPVWSLAAPDLLGNDKEQVRP